MQAPEHSFSGLAPLHQAIADDDMPAMERHIGDARQPWLELNGQHALTLATLLGRTAMVERLLHAGAKPVHGDLLGHTPLHWAALTRNSEIAALLLAHGASEGLPNVFFGTPADCATDAAALSLRVALPEGVQTWTAGQTQAEIGLELLPRSRIERSWLAHLLTVMADDDGIERIYRALPKRPLPSGPEPAVALKHYGAEMGWGVCALEPIEAGRFVGSYLGQVHATDAALPFNPYLATPLASRALGRLRMSIDARHAGNWVSRVNSSTSAASANLTPHEGFRAGAPVLDLWSARAIAPGEQLLWYYGDAYWQRHPGPRLGD